MLGRAAHSHGLSPAGSLAGGRHLGLRVAAVLVQAVPGGGEVVLRGRHHGDDGDWWGRQTVTVGRGPGEGRGGGRHRDRVVRRPGQAGTDRALLARIAPVGPQGVALAGDPSPGVSAVVRHAGERVPGLVLPSDLDEDVFVWDQTLPAPHTAPPPVRAGLAVEDDDVALHEAHLPGAAGCEVVLSYRLQDLGL